MGRIRAGDGSSARRCRGPSPGLAIRDRTPGQVGTRAGRVSDLSLRAGGTKLVAEMAVSSVETDLDRLRARIDMMRLAPAGGHQPPRRYPDLFFGSLYEPDKGCGRLLPHDLNRFSPCPSPSCGSMVRTVHYGGTS